MAKHHPLRIRPRLALSAFATPVQWSVKIPVKVVPVPRVHGRSRWLQVFLLLLMRRGDERSTGQGFGGQELGCRPLLATL